MLVRLYQPEDREQLRRLYEKGGQQDTDPALPLHFVSLVAEDEGRVVAAMVCRLTCEAMLVVDHEYGSDYRRLSVVGKLWREAVRRVREFGLREIHAPVAPWLERFAEGMERLAGFTRDPRRRLIHNLMETGNEGQ